MASQIQICNMALRRIAEQPINALDEGSEAANVIDNVWDIAFKEELRAYPYTWACATAELAQVDETIPDFSYAYQLPADYLNIQSLIHTNDGSVIYDVWEEMYGTNIYSNAEWEIRDSKLYCNLSELTIKYTKIVGDYSKLDPTFVDAFAWRLAYEIGPSITTRADMVQQAYQLYQIAINKARGMTGAEKRRRMKLSREYLQRRNYSRG